MRIAALNSHSLKHACLDLASNDACLRLVHETYGPPPLWNRPTGFSTLLQIILEQQVSLASAKACFDKLAARLGEVTPKELLTINDADLKTIGFSRQKAAYAKHLSEAILTKRIDLARLHKLPDGDAKAELMKLKGVGEWTSDIYLLMAMLRPDVMPKGDIALHEAYRKLTHGDKRPESDEFVTIAEKWKPFRSVAARLLWHFYLSEKRPTALHKPAALARAINATLEVIALANLRLVHYFEAMKKFSMSAAEQIKPKGPSALIIIRARRLMLFTIWAIFLILLQITSSIWSFQITLSNMCRM